MVPLLMFYLPTPNKVIMRLPMRAASQFLWPSNTIVSPFGEVSLKLVAVLIGSQAIAMIGSRFAMVVVCFSDFEFKW